MQASSEHQDVSDDDFSELYSDVTIAPSEARSIIRLIQCQQCSQPFRNPITIPCGHSICKECLPTPFERPNITYPRTSDREQGITCPIPHCEQSHPLQECKNDVVLTRVMDAIHAVAAKPHLAQAAEQVDVNIKLKPRDEATPSRSGKEGFTFRSVPGGQILGTFNLASSENLDFEDDCDYTAQENAVEICQELDEAVLQEMKAAVVKELDCQICYSMLLDPVTASCGHTFCRKCLARVLDHTSLCPACRNSLPMAPKLIKHPNNLRLVSLLVKLWPEETAARMEAVRAEEEGLGELNTPLFVCNLAFIGQPCYLHIFEPRYRLMIRRAWQGNKRFGMLAYNGRGVPQGDLGVVNFMQYGTMLEIIHVGLLQDGRSLIETRGLYTFKVKGHGNLDGYMVGDVERIDDISLTEEEEQEQKEISEASRQEPEPEPAATMENAEETTPTDPLAVSTPPPPIDSMTTEELYQTGRAFVERMRGASARWLGRTIIEAYGDVPDDPAMFPYWFASVLPITDDEKYALLTTNSVRGRLKITIGWIRRIDSRRW